MRAIVVEFAEPVLALPGVIDAEAIEIGPGDAHAPRGEGSLAPRRTARVVESEGAEGEPL